MKTIKIIGLAVGAAVAALAVLAISNPGHKAETSAADEDEFLRSRRYRIDWRTFVGETEKIVPTLTKYGQNWKLISTEITQNSALIKVEVPVLVFTDDLEIRADAQNGETVVDIHSSSRVGHSDLGENRRHLRQLLRALDKKFDAR